MTTTSAPRRSTAAGAAILVAVVLLFATVAFVAGLAVGGGDGIGLSQPTPAAPGAASQSPTPTPGPTPILETISCAEPSEAFAVLCETYAQIKGDYVDEITDEELVDGAVRGMIE